MRFDWRRFCDTNGIDYVETGAGTARGNIYIDCPFCPDGEGKHHLGLSLNSATWGCWKTKAHAGRRAKYLIATLLRCSISDAQAYETDQDWVSDDWGQLEAAAKALGKVDAEDDPRRPFEPWPLPPELFKLQVSNPSAHAFFDYIYYKRKIPRPVDFAKCYNLYGAVSGDFRWRVVSPISRNGMIIGATGRHIGRSSLRYYTMPGDVTNRTLVNYDAAAQLSPGGVLVLNEGPWDAFNLDWYFVRKRMNACAMGLAGLGYDGIKRNELAALARRYKIARVIVLLDRGEEDKSLYIETDLQAAGVPAAVGYVPNDCKDPGEMSAAQIRAVVQAYV